MYSKLSKFIKLCVEFYRLLKVNVWSIALYECKSWTIEKNHRKNIEEFEM